MASCHARKCACKRSLRRHSEERGKMLRSLTAAAAFLSAATVLVFPAASGASGGNGPMHFALRQQGPAQVCGTTCRTYVVASGAITADTPTEFRNFAKNLNLKGALVVLESEGGSVHGDRKSTRLNSSHMSISYAVFCLKKKNNKKKKKIKAEKP